MNDENPDSETSSRTVDDPRFEVKWQKKERSSPPPVLASEDADSITEDSDLSRRLEEAEKRVAELQDRWQRAEANLANMRKRNEQERGEIEKFAAMMLAAELLPVLDNFDRALATIPGNLAMLTWVHGIVLTERHMRAILEHQGVTLIEAEGKPFDPHVHEAIGERESDSVAPGNVLQVYQQGYTMHGRVLRPALVELATAPSPAEESTPETNEPADAGSESEEPSEA